MIFSLALLRYSWLNIRDCMRVPEAESALIILIVILTVLLVLEILAHRSMLAAYSEGHVISGVIDDLLRGFNLCFLLHLFAFLLQSSAVELNVLRLKKRGPHRKACKSSEHRLASAHALLFAHRGKGLALE